MCQKQRFFFISQHRSMYPAGSETPARSFLSDPAPAPVNVPSSIQLPAQACLRTRMPDCGGSGFLLARRKMRWRKGDTCLSEASCVTFSPPLAFACKLRGTAPKIISARGRRLTGASPKPITYTTTAGNFTAIFTTSISAGSFSFKNPSMKSMKICSSP